MNPAEVKAARERLHQAAEWTDGRGEPLENVFVIAKDLTLLLDLLDRAAEVTGEFAAEYPELNPLAMVSRDHLVSSHHRAAELHKLLVGHD